MSPRSFTNNRKTLSILLACVLLLIYLITPPEGVEYDLGGLLTIRNIRDTYQKCLWTVYISLRFTKRQNKL